MAAINKKNNTIAFDERAKTVEINKRDCQTVKEEDIVIVKKGRIDAKGKVYLNLTEKGVKDAITNFMKI
ncbi:hypothetical protein FSP39_008604 [Pinctada imbricata]|uniref:Uncharacterized protein n=1 Tax=Pinctada imbricata TaxID=66713 RepID=A0AA89C287_PINIB|nr:hypothetical protein FSP39_008604 [Pinctada imbricata]